MRSFVFALTLLASAGAVHAADFTQACSSAKEGSLMNCACLGKQLSAHQQKEFVRLAQAHQDGNFTRYDESSEFKLGRQIRDLTAACPAQPAPGFTNVSLR